MYRDTQDLGIQVLKPDSTVVVVVVVVEGLQRGIVELKVWTVRKLPKRDLRSSEK